MSDVFQTPRYEHSLLPHSECSCTGWGSGHHHPASANLPHVSSYLLCSARCDAEGISWALHPMHPGGLKSPKSRSLLTWMFWWKWFGETSPEKLRWQADKKNVTAHCSQNTLVLSCVISDMNEDVTLPFPNALLCSLWLHWWTTCHVSLFKYLSFVPVKIYFRKYLTPGIWTKL